MRFFNSRFLLYRVRLDWSDPYGGRRIRLWWRGTRRSLCPNSSSDPFSTIDEYFRYEVLVQGSPGRSRDPIDVNWKVGESGGVIKLNCQCLTDIYGRWLDRRFPSLYRRETSLESLSMVGNLCSTTYFHRDFHVWHTTLYLLLSLTVVYTSVYKDSSTLNSIRTSYDGPSPSVVPPWRGPYFLYLYPTSPSPVFLPSFQRTLVLTSQDSSLQWIRSS